MANNTWRDRSVHGGTAWHFGHCGITSGATAGDCSMGLVGSFGLSSQAAKSGWPTAIHECVLKCRSCEQCRYVTVSLQYQDCSERTVSQVLSLEKALSLRREHELEVGEKYDLVLVARHDITLLRPLRLPPAVFGLAGRDVVFPFYCPGRCQGEPAVTPSGATSCTLGGQQCPVTYGGRSPAEFTYWMIDWLFLGAPDAVDAMGDATRRLNEYAMALSRFSPYLGTHALWPWHALSTNLSLHWGLLVTERDHVTLARHVATGTLSRACWWERSGPPPEPLHLQRPALLDQMCPYAKLSKCSCRTHERALVTSRNGEIVDVPAVV